MPTADMTRLLDQTRIRVPGVIDSVIRLELFSTLGYFFRESNVWRDVVTFGVTPAAGDAYTNPAGFTYTATPALGLAHRLMGVTDAAGRPVPADMPSPGTIRLLRNPASAQDYKAYYSLTVVDPVTGDDLPAFPDWVMAKYRDDIQDGLLGRLMSQPAKPYTSPSLAATHLRMFRNAVVKARIESRRDNTFATQRWQFPKGFA